MNDSVVLAALKALSNETKALLMVSELGARRMPSFQLRTIFNALIKDDDERRIIVDLIDKELHASGVPEDKVFALLNDLLTIPNALQMNDAVQSTRRLRSPFVQNFEGQMPAQIGVSLSPAQNGAPILGAVQYNPRSSFAANPSEPQRATHSQVFKRPTSGAGTEDDRAFVSPTRTGSFPVASGQNGYPARGNPTRETIAPGMTPMPSQRQSPSPINQQAVDTRNGSGAPVSPSSQRYSQNAFHNPDDLPPAVSKPQGFTKNSYSAPDSVSPISAAPGLPGLPGMPPVTVRPQAPPPQGMPAPALSQRRFGMDTRLSASASAQAVSEAALLTPGLANVSGPLASKIISRTDGSPNSFQGGTTSTVRNGDGRPVILIADDDKRIRMVFRLRMEESGLTVVECADGTEAWDRIQQGDIALAVLDMKMPGLHGLEVLSRMADKQFRIPVIVCSAYDQLKDEFVVQTYPRLRYLVKPVAPEQLVGSIKELLVKQPA